MIKAAEQGSENAKDYLSVRSETKILADEEKELVESLGVKQAPTLVIRKNGEIEKYTGVSQIKKYLNI